MVRGRGWLLPSFQASPLLGTPRGGVRGIRGAGVGSVGHSCPCGWWHHRGPALGRRFTSQSKILARSPAQGAGFLPAVAWRGRTPRGQGEAWRQAVVSAGYLSNTCLLSTLVSCPCSLSLSWQAVSLGPHAPCSVTRLVCFSVDLFSSSSPVSPSPAETSSRHRPRPLRVPPTKLARWVARCGQQLNGGWVQR